MFALPPFGTSYNRLVIVFVVKKKKVKNGMWLRENVPTFGVRCSPYHGTVLRDAALPGLS